jgi:hypothetical protein
MKSEDRIRLKKNISEVYKRTWILRGLGAAIGGGVGGFISAIKGNYIYAGVGAFTGGILAELIGMLFERLITLQQLSSFRKLLFWVLGVLCLLLSIAGIIVYYLTGEWISIIGALFFVSCGIYYLLSSTKGSASD